MYGTCCASAGFHNPLGCPTRRRSYGNLKPAFLHDVKQGIDYCGLSRAGASGDDGNSAYEGVFYRCGLLPGQLYAAGRACFFYHGVRIGRYGCQPLRRLCQGCKLAGYSAFRPVKAVKIQQLSTAQICKLHISRKGHVLNHIPHQVSI